MLVKVRCGECGAKHKVKVANIKNARKLKRNNKDYICDKCKFKVYLRNMAKQVINGIRKLC